MQQLQNTKPPKFIIENNPFGNDDAPPSSGTYTITGRILPTCDLYNKSAIRMDIILGPQCPMKPPAVRLQSKIYHPNVAEDGKRK
jgi:ubiquitin-protein ligase